jgi:hypothetical protein
MRNLLLLAAAGCEPLVLGFHSGEGPSGSNTPELPHDPILVAARSDESEPRPCPEPEARSRLGPFEARVQEGPPASRAYLWAAGVLAGDLDSDGNLDIVAPFEPYTKLFRGRGNGRMMDWDDRLASFDLSMGSAGSVADHDGDGDLDMLLLRYDEPAVLLRNEGNGEFTDVSTELGIVDGPTTSSAWADTDGDGDLDLFIGSYGYLGEQHQPGRSYLFENTGFGLFIDRSAELPEILHEGYTRVAGFHDLNGDGLPELYVVNDIGSVAPNVLLRNVGGRFVEDDNASGLDLQMSGGGLGVGDLNGDDRPDFLIPQWDELSLMQSGEGGRWFDYAAVRGLVPDSERGQRVGWGAELADLDNDGDLDGLVAYGAIEVDEEVEQGWDNPEVQPDALFLQQPDGTFVDVAPEWGLDDGGKNRGFVLADFDDDGWLDAAMRNLDGQNTLYLSRCGSEHYLKVRVRDTAIANQLGVGARVKILAEDGRSWVRWVTAGGTGYGTGGPPEVHFGLGELQQIERVEVLWPDGTESWVAFGAGVDRTITVSRQAQ